MSLHSDFFFLQIKHISQGIKQMDTIGPVECETCGKTFENTRKLKKHALIHREKSYSCNTCGKSFSLPFYLRSHSLIHTEEKTYSCETCGKSFRHQSSLRSHLMVHTGLKRWVFDDNVGMIFQMASYKCVVCIN